MKGLVLILKANIENIRSSLAQTVHCSPTFMQVFLSHGQLLDDSALKAAVHDVPRQLHGFDVIQGHRLLEVRPRHKSSLFLKFDHSKRKRDLKQECTQLLTSLLAHLFIFFA